MKLKKHCWLSMLISILMLFCTGLSVSVSATFLNVYDLNGDNQLDGFDLSLLKNEAINGNRPLTDVILLQRLILNNDVISSINYAIIVEIYNINFTLSERSSRL